VHDVAAGEMLNIGVVLYAPGANYLGVCVDTHYERLSHAFAGFDGETYRQVLRRFELAVERFRQQQLESLRLQDIPERVDGITSQIWPDEDLSFRFGPVLAGIAKAPEDELAAIFDRMVLSQFPRDERQRRTDEEVWTIYRRPLSDLSVTPFLQPKTIETRDFSFTFDYAFKNERWHALQPVSLDFARPESIQRKAAQWLGNCTALKDQQELRTVYILLGQPQLSAHKAAYDRAKSLLDKIPVRHQLVEEDSASDFASEVRAYMNQHGVTPSE
jgi:hypothetical protein